MERETGNIIFDQRGCDFLLYLPAGRRIKLLHLTDMQIIDSSCQRFPDRLDAAETDCWKPENQDVLCFDHIRSLVAQTGPDLILVTGDMVYGEFDDTGKTFCTFCDFMNGLQVPWAPVFGNHDNESLRGVAWQCARLEEGSACLFRRGTVHGNGNYTVGIVQGERLIRVLYMMDSNACGRTTDPEVYRHIGFGEDQVDWLRDRIRTIQANGPVPGFLACHIPMTEFALAAKEKGYQTEDPRKSYVIGVDVPALDGDFGCKREVHSMFASPADFRDILSAGRIDGVFAGHCHAINTSILWQGIRWTFGLKTGQYDYHIPGQMGGTLITLNPQALPTAPADNSESAPFTVRHVPALTLYGPFPKGT